MEEMKYLSEKMLFNGISSKKILALFEDIEKDGKKLILLTLNTENFQKELNEIEKQVKQIKHKEYYQKTAEKQIQYRKISVQRKKESDLKKKETEWTHTIKDPKTGKKTTFIVHK